MNPMKKTQKLIYTGVLVVSVLFFIYSLGFSTNMAFATNRIKEFGASTQLFNHIIFFTALLLFLIVVALRMFDSSKRIIFYKSNFVISLVMSVMLIVTAVGSFIGSMTLHLQYKKVLVDYAAELEILEYSRGTILTESTYYMGYVISILMIAMAIALVIFLKKKKASQEQMFKEREALLHD